MKTIAVLTPDVALTMSKFAIIPHAKFYESNGVVEVHDVRYRIIGEYEDVRRYNGIELDGLLVLSHKTTPKKMLYFFASRVNRNRFCPPTCQYLYPTEEEQKIKGAREKHICVKYGGGLFHYDSHPNLHRLTECTES